MPYSSTKRSIVACVAVICCVTAQSPLRNAACQTLAAQYPDELYWPGTPSYTNETEHVWSQTTVAEPYCVFAPKSANEVAAALAVFESTQTQFAVRGNGHMPVKGAASTNQGVMLVLTKFKNITSNDDHSIVSLGPGLTWLEVYDWLQPFSKAVLGGRYATVGIAGYLLGGGVSYYSSQYGWGASSVVNFELVAAGGAVLEVNQTSYPDLFWSLKGGSSNFGIVTRFDLKTFPGPDVFAGTLTYDSATTPRFLAALEDFITPGGGIDDPKLAVLPNIAIDPKSGELTSNSFIFIDGNSNSSLSNFTSLPTMSSTASQRKYTDFIAETLGGTAITPRGAWYATSLKALPDSIKLIAETISSNATISLRNSSATLVDASIQPIGTSWLEAAQKAGGDAINLDPADGSLLALNLIVEWTDEADDALVAKFATDTLSLVDEKSLNLGLYYPFIYTNDAGEGENPFPLYGNGTSLPRMKDVRQKFDPNGTFQYLQPGGFKLGV